MSILKQLRNKDIATCNIGGANMVAVSLSGTPKITVQELKEFSNFYINKCGIYEVVVTISKIYYDEHIGLWYSSCSRCRTGLMEAPDTQYWCQKCEKAYSEGCLRYVFRMEIADHTGSHDVTIFDEVGEKLLGCKAKALSELVMNDNDPIVVLERLRSLTYNRYNLFVMVGNIHGTHTTRPIHEINVIHATSLNPAKEAKYLLDVIESFT